MSKFHGWCQIPNRSKIAWGSFDLQEHKSHPDVVLVMDRNCQKLSKMSKFFKMFNDCQLFKNCKLSKLSKKSTIVNNYQILPTFKKKSHKMFKKNLNCQKMSKLSKSVKKLNFQKLLKFKNQNSKFKNC